MNVVIAVGLLVLLAFTAAAYPRLQPQEELRADQQGNAKWYGLDSAELKAVLKELQTLKTIEGLGNVADVAIFFGKSSSSLVAAKDSYMFDVYRMIDPVSDDVQLLLTPAVGGADKPTPPFQAIPRGVFEGLSRKRGEDQAIDVRRPEIEEPANDLPSNVGFVRGVPVYKLQALGKVLLSDRNVKKMMARRQL